MALIRVTVDKRNVSEGRALKAVSINLRSRESAALVLLPTPTGASKKKSLVPPMKQTISGPCKVIDRFATPDSHSIVRPE